MSSQAEIDVHDELAGAAVTPLHNKTLGVLVRRVNHHRLFSIKAGDTK
jgi:hypothetical protein